MKTGIGFFGVAPLRGAPVFLAVAFLGLHPSNVSAQVVALNPGDNSSIDINTSGPNAGAYDWVADGNNLLNPLGNGSQWFYYSVGAGTPSGVQNIGAVNNTATTSPTPDSASFGSTYTAGSFSLQAVYTLTGGPVGSGKSDLQETITVKNTGVAR